MRGGGWDAEPGVQRRVDLGWDDDARRRDRVVLGQLAHSRGQFLPRLPAATLGGFDVPPGVKRERRVACAGDRPRDVEDLGVPGAPRVALGRAREVDPLVLVEPHPQHRHIGARADGIG